MKLNIKALLPLAILLVGSTNCSVNDRKKLAETISHAMHFEESLKMALEHPAVMIEHGKDDAGNIDFGTWTNYLHNPDVKEDREMVISNDKAYEFYRLELDPSEFEEFTDYLDADPKHTNLDGLENNLKVKINAQLKIKSDYLLEIMKNLPVINRVLIGADEELKSHINAFIANALVFDYTRFSFSNLHKALESIKGAVEVPRKAKHAAEAAIEALKDDNGKYDIVQLKFDLEKFKIKRTETQKVKSESDIDRERKEKEKREKEINLISFALKAADKSTSNPQILFITIIAGLLCTTALITHNAVSVKPDEEEEAVDDEESGSQ